MNVLQVQVETLYPIQEVLVLSQINVVGYIFSTLKKDQTLIDLSCDLLNQHIALGRK